MWLSSSDVSLYYMTKTRMEMSPGALFCLNPQGFAKCVVLNLCYVYAFYVCAFKSLS